MVRRERADTLICKLIAETHAINADPLLWCEITKLSVFGSYLSDKPVLGDLDIAIQVERRWLPGYGNTEKIAQIFQATHPSPKWLARDQFLLEGWPYDYIFWRLKKIGRGIRAHEHHELERLDCNFRTLIHRPKADVKIRIFDL